MRIGLFYGAFCFALGIALAVLGAASCGGSAASHAQAKVAAQSSNAIACTLRGAQMLYPSALIFPDASIAQPSARSSGAVVRFEITEVATAAGARSRVTLRAPTSGPAFVMTGYLNLRQIELYATREIPILPGHAFISNAARVRIVGNGGAAGRARVRADWGDFTSFEAESPCDALTLDVPGDSAVPRLKIQAKTLAHFAHAGATLTDEGGAFLISLGPDGEGATVNVIESHGEKRHILYDDGVRLDAWVDDAALIPGEGPDCDDCHFAVRDLMDRCPDFAADDDDDGCDHDAPIVATALTDVDVHTDPNDKSAIVGLIERRAEMLVLSSPSGVPDTWARIRPRHVELDPMSGDFYVRRTSIEPSALLLRGR